MRIRQLLSWAAVAAVLAFVMVLGSIDTARAATFNPKLAVAVADPTANADSDFTATLNIPDGDVNFAAVISFIPRNWGVVTGDEIPIGDKVGELRADSVLGLANGACNTQLPVVFEMLNAGIDTTDTVPFTDEDENNTNDFADDADGNGIFDGIDRYPDFLNRVFEGLQPIRRSAGVTPVAGIPILLEFLVFAPGTVVDEDLPSDEGLGYPSVTVLQNIGDTEATPAPSIINDFCTPLATQNTSYGKTESGAQSFVNPGDGTAKFTVIGLGQRDADGDGYENSLDTCAQVPNIGNPRVTNDGDLDSDGLDAACDPNDNVLGGTNSDEDNDGYQNRQDNCPLDPNGEEEDNQHDSDLDTIGDACDPNPDDADAQGTYTAAQPVADITIGSGGTELGAAPDEAVCEFCWRDGWVPNFDGGTSGGASSDATTPPAASGSAPAASATPDDGDGGGSGTTIAIIVGVIAAVVVVGGGAALLMRRRSA